MERLKGIPVSPGVAIGEALVLDTSGFRIPRRFVARDAVDDEIDRLNRAIELTCEQIARNRDIVASELGEEYAAIFEAHRKMLLDRRLRAELEELIRGHHHSPEYAVTKVLGRYAQVFERLESHHLAHRAADIVDIQRRLLQNLLGQRREELTRVTSPVVVVAHDLTPSETASLDRRYVLGFATEVGGPGSHTAIVAEALEIPAVVGIGSFLSKVSGGDVVIIDGNRGEVILQPDEETLQYFYRQLDARRTLAAHLATLRDLPAETTDGVRIELMGNIEFPHEAQHCLERGADGIGLYRTEFLYLSANKQPDEEEHFEAYRQVVEAMDSKPVTIRTLDLGAEKIPEFELSDQQRNPALGLRSIRLTLRDLHLFRRQIRAILRASSLGPVRIMFPLVSTLTELRQAKLILYDVMEDLHDRGIPFNRDIKIGIMVEVPATAVLADLFIEEVDFFSIGSNDLTQYTLAVDRANKEVANLFNECDPAVLRLIVQTLKVAQQKNKPVSICGQMCSNPLYTMLLIGLGFRQLSVCPAAIPEVKKVCRSVSIAECEAVAKRALTMDSAQTIKTYLKAELSKRVPELGI